MNTSNFENFYDITWYVNSQGKKITHLRENIPFQVVGGKIELGEIPDYIYKIRINGMTEISLIGLINSLTKFKCNYNTGTLYFDNSQEGQFFNVSFSAKGKIRFRSKNIILEDVHNVYASDNVEDALYEAYQRINNLITSNPQPNEVQDGRANGATGITFDNLKARLDDDSVKIKKAVTDIGNITNLDTTNNTDLVSAINENTNEIINARKGELSLKSKIDKIDLTLDNIPLLWNALPTANTGEGWWQDNRTGLIMQVGYAYFEGADVYDGREFYVSFPKKFPNGVLITIPNIEVTSSYQHDAFGIIHENLSARNLYGSSYFVKVNSNGNGLGLRVFAIGF